MAAQRRAWPVDVWTAALHANSDPTAKAARIVSTLNVAIEWCRQQPAAEDWRVWAFDLPQRAGAAGAPKRYLVAPTPAFTDAYQRVPPLDRHAYEVLHMERPCWPYFDLDLRVTAAEQACVAEELAQAVASISTRHLAAVAQRQLPGAQLDLRAIALDSHRHDKFSRHLVLHVHAITANGSRVPVPLATLADAASLAQRVSAELETGVNAVAGLVDMAVYGDKRCFRIYGSSKYGSGAVLALNAERSHAEFAGLGAPALTLASLVAPLTEPPVMLQLATRCPAPAADTLPCVLHHNRPTATVATGGCSMTVDQWRRCFARLTDRPRLDMPRLRHPFVASLVVGKGAPPSPFEPLSRWAAAHLRRLKCATSSGIGANGVVRSWRYEHTTEPIERLLHVVGSRGHCHHVGRTHASHNVMVTVDLMSGEAFQRCWDSRCIIKLDGGGYLKAKHVLGGVPACCLPALLALGSFEAAHVTRGK